MNVIFRTNELRRCYEEASRAIQRWGPDVGRRYITRVETLARAEDFRTLYRIQGLRLHPLQGTRRRELSIY